MARKRTGLRNRQRPNGSSQYCLKGKAAHADSYGDWLNGRCTRPERIAGQTRSRQHKFPPMDGA